MFACMHAKYSIQEAFLRPMNDIFEARCSSDNYALDLCCCSTSLISLCLTLSSSAEFIMLPNLRALSTPPQPHSLLSASRNALITPPHSRGLQESALHWNLSSCSRLPRPLISPRCPLLLFSLRTCKVSSFTPAIRPFFSGESYCRL